MLAEHAKVSAISIQDPDLRKHELAQVALALTTAGDLEYGETIARASEDPKNVADILTDMAEAAARVKNFNGAQMLAGKAEAVARAIIDPGIDRRRWLRWHALRLRLATCSGPRRQPVP